MQVSFTSQERACPSTLDFHLQVNSLSRSCLQVHFWLALRSHFTSQDRACKCTGDFHSQDTSPLSSSHSGSLPLWHGSLFVMQSSCSCEPDTTTSSVRRTPTVGLVLLVGQCLLRYSSTSSRTGSHSTLSSLVSSLYSFLTLLSSCSNELILATRCHLNKIKY